MIPSENTANRVSAPPENRSMNWSADSCCPVVALRSSASRLGSTLGTGMWEPSRNTAMIPIVNKIFFRRSGILNALTKAFSMVPADPLGRAGRRSSSLQAENLHGAACPLDLGPGRAGDGVSANGQGLVQRAVAQDLHRTRGGDHALGSEQFRRDLGPRVEGLAQSAHVHHRPQGAVRVAEALELGDAALEGHLSALEPGLRIVPGPVALGAAACGLALPRGLAPAEPSARADGSLGRPKVVDLHPSPPTSSTLTR